MITEDKRAWPVQGIRSVSVRFKGSGSGMRRVGGGPLWGGSRGLLCDLSQRDNQVPG